MLRAGGSAVSKPEQSERADLFTFQTTLRCLCSFPRVNGLLGALNWTGRPKASSPIEDGPPNSAIYSRRHLYEQQNLRVQPLLSVACENVLPGREKTILFWKRPLSREIDDGHGGSRYRRITRYDCIEANSTSSRKWNWAHVWLFSSSFLERTEDVYIENEIKRAGALDAVVRATQGDFLNR